MFGNNWKHRKRGGVDAADRPNGLSHPMLLDLAQLAGQAIRLSSYVVDTTLDHYAAPKSPMSTPEAGSSRASTFAALRSVGIGRLLISR